VSAPEKGGEEQEAPEGSNAGEPGCAKNEVGVITDAPWRGDSMEYLLWWMKGSRLPSVLPGTFSVGTSQLDTAPHSGGRFTLGVPIDKENQHLGLEGTYLFLGTRTDSVITGAVDNIAFARPPAGVFAPMALLAPIDAPAPATRSVLESASSRLQGAELNGVGQLWNEDHSQLDLLVGFRYFEVDEGVSLQQRLTDPSTVEIAPLITDSADQFDGHNRFYGGQLGLRGELHKGSCFVSFLGKVAIGETYEVVKVSGLTETTGLGTTPQAFPGGLLTSPANSGRFVHGAFAVLPEVGLRAGYDFGERTRIFVGYNFLYLSSAARPADQIGSGSIATPLVFGPALPLVRSTSGGVHDSDFWTQGLTVGFEFRY
jgi:hypothetical protein